MPLGAGSAPHGDMDIPLEQVRSNASSSGARKQNQGITSSLSSADAEKHGFFHRGRRQARKAGDGDGTQTDRLASREADVNFMGRMYKKVVGFSVVTRYLVYIVPVTILLAVPIIVLVIMQPLHGAESSFTKLGNFTPQGADGKDLAPVLGPRLLFFFVWVLASWLAIWVGKLVAHMLAPVFMFFCGVVSAGTRKYATVIRALELYLSFFFASLASWLIFQNLFKDFDEIPWVWVIKRLLGAVFVSTAVLLGEKAIVQLIGISYHQRSFANRITDSKREVHLLGIMFDASRQLFPMYGPDFAQEDYIISDSIEARLNGGKKRHSKNGAQTPMALLAKAGGNVGRLGDKVTSIFGHVASEITGKQVFNPNSAHSIVVEALEKVKTSEALAKRIWMSFVCEGNDNLYGDDIQEVLGPAYRDEADECFSAIDADGNGDISLDEMIRKVVEIGKERKAIAHSMKDIGQALGVFDGVLLFVVVLICVFVFRKSYSSKTGPLKVNPADILVCSVILPELFLDHRRDCWHCLAVTFFRLRGYHTRVSRFMHLLVCQTSLRCWRPCRYRRPREGAVDCREDLSALHCVQPHRQDADRAGPQHCPKQPLDRERHEEQGYEGSHRHQRLLRHHV